MSERWVTDDDLRDAAMRLVHLMPGFRLPAAYTVGLVEGDRLRFGYLNGPGGSHHLPGVVLAYVCGHRAGSATSELNAVEFGRAIELLTPAEAATHWEHPNLWSWRPLLAEAPEGARFVACFVDDLDSESVNAWDAQFREALNFF